jgi:SagB-type dehydrogenase family enzyme
MLLRRAHCLVAWYQDERLVLHNYVARTAIRCDVDWLEFLASVDAARPEELADRLRNRGCGVPDEALGALVQLRILLEIGSVDEQSDALVAEKWTWGPAAGLLHFGTRNLAWATVEQEEQHFARIAEQDASSVLWSTFGADEDPIDLPRSQSSFLCLAARRGTTRTYVPGEIGLTQLSQCLYAGVGFRGEIKLPLRPPLPLKMTPSAGARNPIEAYAVCQDVSGLTRGVYQYSGHSHQLRCVRESVGPLNIPDLLGGQQWFRDAAAVIFLVALFERPLMKYRVASAYGAVLIEAGHIAQNMVLAATECGLASATTMALDHSKVEELLGESDVLHGALYGIVIGTSGDGQ